MNVRNAQTLARVVQNRRTQRGLSPIDMSEWTDIPSILTIGATAAPSEQTGAKGSPTAGAASAAAPNANALALARALAQRQKLQDAAKKANEAGVQ
jgi:hypothetical protein